MNKGENNNNKKANMSTELETVGRSNVQHEIRTQTWWKIGIKTGRRRLVAAASGCMEYGIVRSL
jgi:hypothetical protein